MQSQEAHDPKRYTSLKLVIRTLLQLLKIFYYDKSSFGNVANMLKYYNKNGLVESFVRSSIVPISCFYPSLCCHAHTSSNLTVIICTAQVTSVLCHTWRDTHHLHVVAHLNSARPGLKSGQKWIILLKFRDIDNNITHHNKDDDHLHHYRVHDCHHHYQYHLVVLLHQPRTLHLLWPPQHEHHVTRPGNYSLQLLLAHVMQNCSTEAGAWICTERTVTA